ncbi:M1 family aminopeptidase [Streptomyces sp. H10-C2]|uniref:M1 family aminopeptidase n=1 Tax=unclassified Streptomyces TaxID=2593676 RepID=UPI0024B936FD|nr:MULTISPECIES: M1 family aminopeptidase [unclassified Streptomyces]MDJ0347113.1 M1 family aminopeptidase [Streptomyces sp. PH10-H1]MDJ0375338.1 M1 family aminopeptidase [Streptomyces sp. H10-C2]
MRRSPHKAVAASALAVAALAAVTLPATTATAVAPAGRQAATCTPTQVVSNGGFENGTSPWSQSSGVITNRTGQTAHAGTYFAWLNGVGSTHTDTLSQSVTVPSGCSTATLTFWLHIDTTETTSSTAYDKLTAKIGSTTLATYSNLNKNTGYVQKSFDVSAFAGQTVALAFTGTEDSSLQTSFVVDDVALNTSDTTPPPTGDPTRTPASPAYTVSLTSNTSGTVWTGHESATFTNASATALSEVYLRLWDNAHGTCAGMPITVSNVTGGTAGSLSVGCTALRVALPGPLAQGQKATIGFDLGITVPSGADRFGYDGAFSFIGNALPVLAVKDSAGWHLDPYTNNGESFYALASDFAVTLDHPSGLLIPATGASTDTPGSSGRTITTATATKVREFAWAAGPFSKISGTSASGTPVNVYSVSGISSASAQSMLTTAKSAVDAHASRFGAYPYGELDAVIDNNFWFGGMEYPGFVLDLVSTTALTHEIGHQWWYGIVGDDEYTSPWLDEAFTDYATDLALNKTGTGCWNSVSWASAAEKITNSMAYWDANSSRYSTVVYGYGKCALHDLRRLLGDTVMAKVLRDYATAHWYGVSTTAEFKAAAQAATTTDLTSFWTQHRIDG